MKKYSDEIFETEQKLIEKFGYKKNKEIETFGNNSYQIVSALLKFDFVRINSSLAKEIATDDMNIVIFNISNWGGSVDVAYIKKELYEKLNLEQITKNRRRLQNKINRYEKEIEYLELTNKHEKAKEKRKKCEEFYKELSQLLKI